MTSLCTSFPTLLPITSLPCSSGGPGGTRLTPSNGRQQLYQRQAQVQAQVRQDPRAKCNIQKHTWSDYLQVCWVVYNSILITEKRKIFLQVLQRFLKEKTDSKHEQHRKKTEDHNSTAPHDGTAAQNTTQGSRAPQQTTRTPEHATRRQLRTTRPNTAPQNTKRKRHNTQQHATAPGARNSADHRNSTLQGHQHSAAQHCTERGGQGTHSKTPQDTHSTKHSGEQQQAFTHHGKTHTAQSTQRRETPQNKAPRAAGQCSAGVALPTAPRQ